MPSYDSTSANGGHSGVDSTSHAQNASIGETYQHSLTVRQNSTLASETETVTTTTTTEDHTSSGQASSQDDYNWSTSASTNWPDSSSTYEESLRELRDTTDSYQTYGHLSYTVAPGDPPPEVSLVLTNHVGGTLDELIESSWSSSQTGEINESDGGSNSSPYSDSYSETIPEVGFYGDKYYVGGSGPGAGGVVIFDVHNAPVSGSAPAYDEGRGPGKLEEGADRHGGFEGFPEGSGFTATSKGPSAYNGPSSAPPAPAAGPTMPGPSMERVIPSPVTPAAGAVNPASSGANAFTLMLSCGRHTRKAVNDRVVR